MPFIYFLILITFSEVCPLPKRYSKHTEIESTYLDASQRIRNERNEKTNVISDSKRDATIQISEAITNVTLELKELISLTFPTKSEANNSHNSLSEHMELNIDKRRSFISQCNDSLSFKNIIVILGEVLTIRKNVNYLIADCKFHNLRINSLEKCIKGRIEENEKLVDAKVKEIEIEIAAFVEKSNQCIISRFNDVISMIKKISDSIANVGSNSGQEMVQKQIVDPLPDDATKSNPETKVETILDLSQKSVTQETPQSIRLFKPNLIKESTDGLTYGTNSKLMLGTHFQLDPSSTSALYTDAIIPQSTGESTKIQSTMKPTTETTTQLVIEKSSEYIMAPSFPSSPKSTNLNPCTIEERPVETTAIHITVPPTKTSFNVLVDAITKSSSKYEVGSTQETVRYTSTVNDGSTASNHIATTTKTETKPKSGTERTEELTPEPKTYLQITSITTTNRTERVDRLLDSSNRITSDITSDRILQQ